MKKITSIIIVHIGILCMLLTCIYSIHIYMYPHFSVVHSLLLASGVSLVSMAADILIQLYGIGQTKENMFRLLMIRGFKFLNFLVLTLIAVLYSSNTLFYGLEIVALYTIYTIIEFIYIFNSRTIS